MTYDWRARVIERMEELGLKKVDVVRRAQLNYSQLSDLLARGHTPRLDTAVKIAHALGMSLSSLFEGDDKASVELLLAGESKGASMWVEYGSQKGRVIPLEFFAQNSVSIEVSDNSLLPYYRPGDILSGPKTIGVHLDNMLGVECIICLMDGRRYIGKLMRGSNKTKFNIRLLDPNLEEIRDVTPAWVAPVKLILRANP